ncbi:MAG: PspC domain-containing protein [Kiritimatiellaeota bacterium]|nr:PspC domain-containing protein [Kiritimatiellota bacterium]
MPLTKSAKERILAGVCGGIAEWLGWDPTLVRIAFVAIAIMSGGMPGIAAYIILWLIMPGPRH